MPGFLFVIDKPANRRDEWLMIMKKNTYINNAYSYAFPFEDFWKISDTP